MALGDIEGALEAGPETHRNTGNTSRLWVVMLLPTRQKIPIKKDDNKKGDPNNFRNSKTESSSLGLRSL